MDKFINGVDKGWEKNDFFVIDYRGGDEEWVGGRGVFVFRWILFSCVVMLILWVLMVVMGENWFKIDIELVLICKVEFENIINLDINK